MQMFIGTKSTDCSICLGEYRDPRYLPCGHTFCTPCIQQLVNSLDLVYTYIGLRFFRCPHCRNIVEVKAQGAEVFPRDVKVDEKLAKRTVGQRTGREHNQFARRRADLLAEIRAEKKATERFKQLAERSARELAGRIATQGDSTYVILFLLVVVAGLVLHGYYKDFYREKGTTCPKCRLCTECQRCPVRQPCPMCQPCTVCQPCTGSEKLRPCLITVERLKEKVDYLNDELKPTYNLTLIKTYELEPEGSRAVALITLIDGKLLIANAINGELKLRDSYSVTKESNWTTIPSSTVAGMGVCPKNGQVFVSTWNKDIFRFSSKGKMLSQWPVEASGTIYVTKNCNVVLAARDYSMKILVYSSSGERISEIKMESDIRKSRLIKAVPLSKGGFVVSYGDGDDPEHGIDIINANGESLRSYGGRKGSGNHQLNFPRDFAVDKFGNVFVVDSGNKRILLLDSQLKFQRELLSAGTEQRLQHPFGILLNECETLLYVADNEWKPTSEKWTNGRIMVFKTK